MAPVTRAQMHRRTACTKQGRGLAHFRVLREFLGRFGVGWHMGGCQNYDPFWGTLNIRCRSIVGIQKGTRILRTTHVFDFGCRGIQVLDRS